MARRLRAALMAVLLALPGAPARSEGDGAGYKLLRLDGQPLRWGQARYEAVTYGFLRSGTTSGVRNCRPMLPIDATLARSGLGIDEARRAAREAFDRWSAAAGIEFREVAAARADIVIGTMTRRRGIAFADVTHRRGAGEYGHLKRALVCLSARETWMVGADGIEETRDLRYVLTHEIGHAIGLDHPGRFGAMMAFGYREGHDALGPGDRAAARRLYGPSRRGIVTARIRPSF